MSFLVSFKNESTCNRIFQSFQTNQTYKEKNNKCVITGNKAKYFDPLTSMHYSNIESFKIIREKYFQKEEDNLLFKIQTLSDLASQKKERLKKLILTNPNNNFNAMGTNSALPASRPVHNSASAYIKNRNNQVDQSKNSEFDNTKMEIDDNIVKKDGCNTLETHGFNNPQQNINNFINNNKNYIDLMNKIGIIKSDPIDFEKKAPIISKYFYFF